MRTGLCVTLQNQTAADLILVRPGELVDILFIRSLVKGKEDSHGSIRNSKP